MSQSFRIPSSRWWLALPVLMFLMAIPSAFWRFEEFIEESSVKTGLIFFSWIFFSGVWLFLAVRQLCTAQVVSVSGEEIQFQRIFFSRVEPSETVTTVTQDQIAFHLYSKKDKMSLSKKRVPIELAQILDGRIVANKEANKPTLASPITPRVD